MFKAQINVQRVTAVALLLIAVAAAQVDAKLTASKVITNAAGQEKLEPADKAKPGDVLEYAATYRNNDKQPVKAVKATLPIPAGMEYVPGTASPAGVTASTDGLQYSTLPLKRTVRLANGTTQEQVVPVNEYRFLRWEIGEMPAAGERTVKARMRVGTGTQLSKASQK